MSKQTVAQAVIEVLKMAKQPMTLADITQAILDQQLYEFNTKDPKGIVRGAIERRCEGVDRKNSTTTKLFEKRPDGKYELKT